MRTLFKGNGAELLDGDARVTGAQQVEVKTREGGTEVLEATKAIVIATGSSTIEIPSFKFDGKQIIGAKEAVSLREIPKRLLVIGGGIIGLELGMRLPEARLASSPWSRRLPTLLPASTPTCAAVVETQAREARRQDPQERQGAGLREAGRRLGRGAASTWAAARPRRS